MSQSAQKYWGEIRFSKSSLCSFGQPCFVDIFAKGARLSSKRVPIRMFPRVLSCFSSFWPAANSHFIVFHRVFDIPPASPSQFLSKFTRFGEGSTITPFWRWGCPPRVFCKFPAKIPGKYERHRRPRQPEADTDMANPPTLCHGVNRPLFGGGFTHPLPPATFDPHPDHRRF